MSKNGIPACYYPTTVMFVDDSNDFLMNFSLQLDPSLAFQLHTTPSTALKTLLQQRDTHHLDRKCFSQYSEAVGCPTTTQTINVDISAIHREVYDAARFSEVSVVVVDFAMPDIDGLEFCQRLKDSPIRKILLTGQADAATGIAAFNNGIIDQFIPKSDTQVIEKVNHAIVELQQRYFQEKSDFTTKALAINAPGFLQDPLFAKFFKDLCLQRNIVEYYLVENTGTFLLLNASGEASWLVIATPVDLEMFLELGRDLSAPHDVMDHLASGKYILHFWHVDRYYDVDPIEWDSYLYPCSPLQGNELYYYAVIDNPSISNLDVEGIVSYNQYLEQMG